MTELHPEIKKVLERIIDRSKDTRKKYLDNINDMENSSEIDRNTISCSNMAHVAASSPKNDQLNILMNKIKEQSKGIGIDCEIKINNIRHQYKGSECGVYCLNFIVEQLKNKSFEKVTRKIVDDDKMLKRRRRFFSFT